MANKENRGWPGYKMVVEPLQVDDAPGLVEGDAPEDVVEGGVRRHARNDGAERIQKVGSESIDLLD